jgi:hypothetical protein
MVRARYVLSETGPWGTLSNVVPFGFNVAFPLVHIGIAKALH